MLYLSTPGRAAGLLTKHHKGDVSKTLCHQATTATRRKKLLDSIIILCAHHCIAVCH